MRGVNWLGDAVMTTPAVVRLRERFPDAHIAMLTKEHLADIWDGHSAINEVISISRGEGSLQLGRRLRPMGFEIGIALPNSFRTGLELRLARIKTRVGYAGRGRWFSLSDRVPHPKEVYRMRKLPPAEVAAAIKSGKRVQPDIPTSGHHVHHYLRLVAALGASAEPCQPVIDIAVGEVGAALDKFGLPTGDRRPLIGINAGAEYGPAKRWPLSHFFSVIHELHAQANCRFVVFGGPADLPLAEILMDLVRKSTGKVSPSIHAVTGKTSLRELAALLKACHAVISNDSGPAHLAAAVGSIVVIPFGSTSPELTAPGIPDTQRHSIIKTPLPCSPCFQRECPIEYRCLREIRPEVVIKETLGHLHENDELIFS